MTGEVMFVTGSVTTMTGEALQAMNGPEKCPEMTGNVELVTGSVIYTTGKTLKDMNGT